MVFYWGTIFTQLTFIYYLFKLLAISIIKSLNYYQYINITNILIYFPWSFFQILQTYSHNSENFIKKISISVTILYNLIFFTAISNKPKNHFKHFLTLTLLSVLDFFLLFCHFNTQKSQLVHLHLNILFNIKQK